MLWSPGHAQCTVFASGVCIHTCSGAFVFVVQSQELCCQHTPSPINGGRRVVVVHLQAMYAKSLPLICVQPTWTHDCGAACVSLLLLCMHGLHVPAGLCTARSMPCQMLTTVMSPCWSPTPTWCCRHCLACRKALMRCLLQPCSLSCRSGRGWWRGGAGLGRSRWTSRWVAATAKAQLTSLPGASNKHTSMPMLPCPP